MSSSNSISSLAVLNIPELVTHICELARPADCARLLRVSRLFFFCGAPSVWKYTYGVTKLFSLLECTMTRIESPQTRKSNIVGNSQLHTDTLLNTLYVIGHKAPRATRVFTL